MAQPSLILDLYAVQKMRGKCGNTGYSLSEEEAHVNSAYKPSARYQSRGCIHLQGNLEMKLSCLLRGKISTFDKQLSSLLYRY